MVEILYFILFLCLVEVFVWVASMTLNLLVSGLAQVLHVVLVGSLPLWLWAARSSGLFPDPFLAVLELEDLPPGLDQDGVNFDQATDRMRLEDEGGLSLSSAALVAGRLRRRARWVRTLEGVLGGRCGVVASVIRGRWVPDLPSTRRSPVASALLGNLKNGAKLLGGGVVANTGGETPRNEVYYVLELPEGDSVLVFPDLLSRLQSYSVFRQRDAALLAALRARAREWCKLSLPAWVWPLAIPGAVALATMTTEAEESSVALIGAVNPTLLSELGR